MPVTRLSETTAEEFPWGTLNWLMGQAIDPNAKQTFGMAVIQPEPSRTHRITTPIAKKSSMSSPEHANTRTATTAINSDRAIAFGFPLGIVHHAINNGDEPLRAFISFSSGDRQTVFLE